MDLDEISNGPERNPRSSRFWVALSAVLLLLAVLALLVRWNGQGSPDAAPSATALPGNPPPTAVLPTVPTVARYVNTGTVCPVVTDHRHTLAVSFTVVSLAATAVTVTGVEPVLPVGGLRPVDTAVTGGICASPAAAPPGTTLEPGRTLLVTLRFELPDDCPHPYPVQADVHVRADGPVVTNRLGVLPDLGGIPFDTCPPNG
jgi:hypothetical protein